MAGQTLISRNHRTSQSAVEDNSSYDPESWEKSPPPSPIKNPFKRKKRRLFWWWSKLILVGLFFVGLDVLTESHFLFPQVETNTVERQKNTTITVSQKQQQQLNLRPDFLNDDGDGDASEDDGASSDDEADDGYVDDEMTKGPVIPRTLIFTHYKNLLNLVPKEDSNLTANELEEMTLAVNVRHSIVVHKRSKKENVNVLFWTDEDCIASLNRTRPKLVPYFKAETEGMYKADMCRGTALLEHGGFYLDVDVGVRQDLWQDLKPTTEFVTAKVHQASNWVDRGFFQAILGAAPGSPIMDRYLELFEKHYDGTDTVKKGPLGVLLLYKAWENFNKPDQIGIPTELYMELLFHENGPLDSGKNKGVLSPAPTWGKRRACHFVVAGVANSEENTEIRLGERGLKIPVVSRIPGSRMCVPAEDSNLDAAQRIESMKWWERT